MTDKPAESAVERWKEFKRDRIGSESPILASLTATAADAAINELLAEVERLNNALMDKDDDYWRPKLRLLQDDRAKAEQRAAAAEERVERLKALVSYLDDADDHNGLLIMQFEDAEEDAQ